MKPRDDAGSVTAFVLLLTVCFASLLGLVAEGGQVLSAREAATNAAEQAARAGAEYLTPASLHDNQVFTGGPVAVSRAEFLMAAAGYKATATTYGDVVTVTVARFKVSTPLLGLVGVPGIWVAASASAKAVAS